MSKTLASPTGVVFVPLLWAVLATPLAAQSREPPRVTETAFELEDGVAMRYAISIPPERDRSGEIPGPLVLALHPGGRSPYYGSWFMQTVVEPAFRSWGAVIVAPDVPDASWATERSERAVMALLEDVVARHSIDRSRILITGFSMGGRGTWYLATRHDDFFTAAIVMASGPGQGAVERLAQTPLYIIHSPDDEVVPYEPVEELALMLTERGYLVQMMRLPRATHGMMGDYVGPLRAAGEWVREQWRARDPGER
jgi:dipeptidyl aminopeptidase/acylaminoacyl peptidase